MVHTTRNPRHRPPPPMHQQVQQWRGIMTKKLAYAAAGEPKLKPRWDVQLG